MRNYTVILCVLLHMASALYAQQPYFLHLDKSRGLPCYQIFNVFQDRKGFIWLASDCGLLRFDGRQFKAYNSADMSARAGSHIREDWKGRIWYKNFNGELYYTEGSQLHRFGTELYQGEPILSDSVLIVLNISGELLRFSLSTGSSEKVSPFNNTASVLYPVSDSLFGYGFHDSISGVPKHDIFAVKGGRPMRHTGEKGYKIFRCLQRNGKFFLLEDDGRNICVFMLNGTERQKILTTPYDGLINGFEITGDRLFILKKTGLVCFNLRTGSWEDPGLPNLSYNHLVADRNGYLWLSTSYDGVFIVPPDAQMIRYPLPARVNGIHEVSGFTFITTINGEVLHLQTNPFKLQTIYRHPLAATLYSILELPAGAKIEQGEMGEYELFTLQGKRFFVSHSGFKDAKIIDGRFMLTAFSGLVRMIDLFKSRVASPWDSVFWKYPPVFPKGRKADERRPPYADLKSYVRASQIAYDSAGKQVFINSIQGLLRLTPSGLYFFPNAQKPVFAQNMQLHNRDLFLHLNSGRLLRWDLRTGQQDSMPFGVNMPAEKIRLQDSLLFLMGHELLVINLNRTSPRPEVIHFPFESHAREFAVLIGRDYWVSSDRELLQIQGTKQKSPSFIPFYVERVYSADTIFTPGQKAVFPSGSNDISISFAWLDYYGQAARLEYKLNDDRWIPLEPGQRVINLASLAPDHYIVGFRANGRNLPETVQFTIRLPWYRQPWFLATAVLSLGAISFLYYRIRLNIHRKEDALLREKANLEKDLRYSVLASIKSQMNPHFLFNALNTLQSFILSENKQKASAFLGKFARLTRKILETSDRYHVTLQEEIEALALYLELEQERFEQLNYTVNVDQNLRVDSIQIPSMIVQPYVENAIKHGLMHRKGKKILNIGFKAESDGMLLITIEDNGIGRARSREINKKHTGRHRPFALEANFKRIEMLKMEDARTSLIFTDLYTEDGQAAGTRVEITLPLKDPNHENNTH